jgi:glycosyltransferase involved in cell wall biosynthesis
MKAAARGDGLPEEHLRSARVAVRDWSDDRPSSGPDLRTGHRKPYRSIGEGVKALVFEQWQGGHYFNYLECLVPRLAAFCDKVVVAVTESAASSELFARQLGQIADLPNVQIDREVALPRERTAMGFRLRLGRNVVDAVARNRPDWLFLPSADEQVLALPLLALGGAKRHLRDIPIDAVLHYKAYTTRGRSRDNLLSSFQRSLLKTGVFTRLHFVNFLQYEDALRFAPPLASLARAAGDPVPQPPHIVAEAARRELGLEVCGRYVGMVGELDFRKAVPTALAAFRTARLGTTDRFLLAGRLHDLYRKLVRDEYQDLVDSGRLIVMDRYLTERELVACFAALNLHCSAYKEPFSGLSSLLLKGIAAGRPVLASDLGWCRAVVRRFGLGQTTSARVDEFARAMAEALDSSAEYREDAAIRRLLEFHSISNFVNSITESACLFAGKPRSTSVRRWSWVLEALPAERRHLR